MADNLILTIYFPLIITGMILTIVWGMSAAGSSRPLKDRRRRNHSAQG